MILYTNLENELIKIKLSELYFEKNIKDIYTICFKRNLYRNLCIYKNDILILEEKNVKEFKYIDNCILYSKIYDISQTADILKYDLKNEKIINIKNGIEANNENSEPIFYGYVDYQWFSKDDYIKFYFSYEKTKAFSILFEYVLNHADRVVIISNDLKEDSTINYEASFLKSKKDDIGYCFYICYYNTPQYLKILNYPIYVILNYIDKKELEKELLIAYDNNFAYLFQTIDLLKEKLKLNNNEELKKYIELKYGKINMGDYKARKNAYIKYTNFSLSADRYHYYQDYFEDKYKNKFKEDYDQLLKEGKINTRWKSEQDVYRLVSFIYPDAIYQYKGKWLKRLSLDIYVPSINVAIEYQGLQHYEAIDYFGGKVNLIKSIERDKRKAQLCKENNINLIYWEHNKKITFEVLKEKLENINIKIRDLPVQDPMHQNTKEKYINFEVIDKIRMEG